ncbi:helix-turn-helix transcriptional regulator [Ferrovibrio terrae]|uniref:Helix-turn-helix transcriptional regulator n=1 Tax=Ferrovibrio terrae TaxID=2594003 RepID=A0A516H621_9PROT|nr:helix-turn-helix transcriptional regulator [Ferrovibrio terrae]QDO99229.1 helix-turn-helix transcriptional regulator [Ferrovibrio terrae]
MSYSEINSSRLLQKLYLAAADDQNLSPFLSELALAYNASLATIATMEGPSRRDGLRVSGCANESEEAPRLPEYYAMRSPFRPIMMLRGNLGRVLTTSSMLSRERQMRDQFVNEFLRPAGHQYLATGIFAQDGDRFNYFVLNRGDRFGEFDEDTIVGLSEMIPHFQTMFQLRGTMIARDRHLDFFTASMAERGVGLVVLDRSGRVQSMNEVASAICCDNDGLVITGGALAAANADDNRKLQQEIFSLMNSPILSRPGSTVFVRRPAGRPYRLQIMPLSLRKYYFAGDGVELAIQIFSEPVAEHGLDATLASQFGLSPSEVRVAEHLVAGHPVKRVAQMLGNSVNTIRVHRRNLYRKLGVARHYDLVRLLGNGLGN